MLVPIQLAKPEINPRDKIHTFFMSTHPLVRKAVIGISPLTKATGLKEHYKTPSSLFSLYITNGYHSYLMLHLIIYKINKTEFNWSYLVMNMFRGRAGFQDSALIPIIWWKTMTIKGFLYQCSCHAHATWIEFLQNVIHIKPRLHSCYKNK